MAEGVRKSFKKIIKAEVERACEFCDITPAAEIDFNICTYSEGDNSAAVENLTAIAGNKKLAEKIYRQACRDVEEETHQAMEALIHNFNTLHSRAGAQVPFSSINYGMDTSPEGRLVMAKRQFFQFLFSNLKPVLITTLTIKIMTYSGRLAKSVQSVSSRIS